MGWQSSSPPRVWVKPPIALEFEAIWGEKGKNQTKGETPARAAADPNFSGAQKKRARGKKEGGWGKRRRGEKEKCGGTPKQDVTASRRLKRLPSSAAIGACGARPGDRKRKPARGRSRLSGGGDAKRKDWVGSNPPVYPWVRGDASDVKLHDFLLIQVVELRVTLARREL